MDDNNNNDKNKLFRNPYSKRIKQQNEIQGE